MGLLLLHLCKGVCLIYFFPLLRMLAIFPPPRFIATWSLSHHNFRMMCYSISVIPALDGALLNDLYTDPLPQIPHSTVPKLTIVEVVPSLKLCCGIMYVDTDAPWCSPFHYHPRIIVISVVWGLRWAVDTVPYEQKRPFSLWKRNAVRWIDRVCHWAKGYPTWEPNISKYARDVEVKLDRF
jgi:hypothetical protein